MLPLCFELIIDERPLWPLVDARADADEDASQPRSPWRGVAAAPSAAPVWRIVGGARELPGARECSPMRGALCRSRPTAVGAGGLLRALRWALWRGDVRYAYSRLRADALADGQSIASFGSAWFLVLFVLGGQPMSQATSGA